MTDISDYETRVLRKMVKGGNEDLICVAALWAARESLERRGMLGRTVEATPDGAHVLYIPTEAGRALVRARDTELTEVLPNQMAEFIAKQEPLGADFEAVWDANAAELYENGERTEASNGHR